MRDDLPLEGMVALEVFAGDGVWEMRHLPQHYAAVIGLEIDYAKMGQFYTKVPHAKDHMVYDYRVGDAFKLIRDPNLGKVQHVFIDHVVGIYGDEDQYCEYFEMLPLAVPVVDPKGGCITINITEQPYGCDLDWYKRRKEYYRVYDPDNLSPSIVARHTTGKIECDTNYKVLDYQVVPRLRREWGDRMTYTYWTFYIKGGDGD
jgi:hypothetical protein